MCALQTPEEPPLLPSDSIVARQCRASSYTELRWMTRTQRELRAWSDLDMSFGFETSRMVLRRGAVGESVSIEDTSKQP